MLCFIIIVFSNHRLTYNRMRAIIGYIKKKKGDPMARRRVNTTRLEIIQAAIEMFMKNGYSATSIKSIADVMDMSTGHLTFYFPTKEHLLAELVDMLCNFQWAEVQKYVEEGETIVSIMERYPNRRNLMKSITEYCENNGLRLDTATMVVVVDE